MQRILHTRTTRLPLYVSRSFSVTPTLWNKSNKNIDLTPFLKRNYLPNWFTKWNLWNPFTTSPQSDLANAEKSVADLQAQLSTLNQEIAAVTNLLVCRVRELDGDIEDAEYGIYWGDDGKANMYCAKIAELKENKKEVMAQLTAKEQQLVLEMEAAVKGAPVEPYTAEELSELIKIRVFATDYEASGKLLGRADAKEQLEKHLTAPRDSNRWHVITTVGIPGSGKTFFLRKGILYDYYKGQSVMVTYNEGTTVDDDGTEDVLVAFARQLVDANCVNKREVDLKRILDWGVVVDAFRMHLRLDNDKQLIVCIDELRVLRDHLKLCNSPVRDLTNEQFALERCRSLRKALMTYQDYCTNFDLPPIRFVWTSLTYLFDQELEQTGSKRRIEQIPLNNLDENNAWSILGDTLQKEVAASATLQWAFQMCCGNPRAIVAGFIAEYDHAKRDGVPVHVHLLLAILRACHFGHSHHPLVKDNIFSVLTNTLTDNDKNSLRVQGALHSHSDESHCLNPALVYHWASKAEDLTPAEAIVAGWVCNYFGSDMLSDSKRFEMQTLFYELLLHVAYAERKEGNKKITVGEYFSPAFVEDGLKDLVINPRKDISVFKPKSLADLASEELYNKLHNSCRVYSDNFREPGVDSLVPLFLSKPGEEEETLHLFCCQNKLVCQKVEGLTDVETKAVSVPAIADLIEWCGKEDHDISVHPLLYTTHRQAMKTKNRKGVWFTHKTMPKWFARLGAARIGFRTDESNQGGSG